jgi:hypothetical protein
LPWRDAAEQARASFDRVCAAAQAVVWTTEAALSGLPLMLDIGVNQLRLRESAAHEQALADLRAQASVAHSRAMDDIVAFLAVETDKATVAEWPRHSGLPVASDALSVADQVRIGTVAVDGPYLAGADGVVLPVLVPLLDHGNLVMTSAPEASDLGQLVRNVVVRALASTGAGQMVLRAFDPALRGHLAPFTILREVNEDLFPPPGVRDEQLEQLLYEMASDVRRVSDLGRGTTTSLGRLRVETGQPIENYQLVVVFDYPRGLSERSAQLLDTLLRTGPSHGVSFLIHHDPTVTSEHAHLVQLERYAQTLDLRGDHVAWSAVPGLAVSVERVPDAGLRSTLATVTNTARHASAPRIPFTQVQPVNELWTESTIEGITAAVGMAGHDTVHLVLGEERTQRHNMLVTGAVGQGKSNFLKVLIHSLAVRYSPTELELYLLDFKDGVTFYPLAPTPDSPDWLPHAKAIGLESDRPYGVAVLEHLVSELTRRARIIKGHGDNIATYRRQNPTAVLPRIVVIIDEFQVLFEDDDPVKDRAVQMLERLARRGRAFGVHLVLASQTISGSMPVTANADGIYSQFPIRIAFKNSANESRQVLSTDNIEAARLRFRGETVINIEFGQVDGNRRAVIAVANDDELAELRHRCWDHRSLDAAPPDVFDGSRPVTLPAMATRLRQLRAHRDPVTRVALLGVPIAVTAKPIGAALTAMPGRHLAIVGSGHRARGIDEDGHDPNLAIGVLQSAAVSLALQHSGRDAEFTILDYLDNTDADRSAITHLIGQLDRLGFPSTHHRNADATAHLQHIAVDLDLRGIGDDEKISHYVLAFALDRAGPLDQPEPGSLIPPVDALRAVLRNGPARRTHLLVWWSNYGMHRSHVGYDSAVTIDIVLALRLDRRDVADLTGHTVTWSPQDNRGLLLDRSQLPAPIPIVPASPLDPDTHDQTLHIDWDTP